MVLSAALLGYVSAISPLEPGTWAALEPLLHATRVAKGAHVAPAGRPAMRLGLLEAGWVRAYYVSPDGSEYSKYLFHGPALVGDYASLLTGEPVRTPQQALTDCTVHFADWPRVQGLIDRHRDLERLARRFAELLYLENERREIELVTLPATERLRLLLERHPTIEQDLPKYQIAAHLGITPTQLSRIRRSGRLST
ncbi:Crp/Fnr family transcriptional regulator [Kineosporia sp. A_224]|uniref:Crp/Fnr family transcriptional regulator n=1 Tax=Kineosporia sp. A_224 TaxID=1962180 RepID=UPI000B4B7AF7|nr:Crp/Fnr family transcriptional regulator [Kineosporia sp. A_224]